MKPKVNKVKLKRKLCFFQKWPKSKLHSFDKVAEKWFHKICFFLQNVDRIF